MIPTKTAFLLHFLWLSCLLSLMSCDEDSFSRVVTIDLPEHTPLPAVHAEFSASTRVPRVFVTNSKGILDPDSVYNIHIDASVRLFKNGSPLGNFAFDYASLSFLDTLDSPLGRQAGDTYLLEVAIPDFETVTATQIMPAAPLLSEVSYERDGAFTPDGFRADELRFRLEDSEPEQINYYKISLENVNVQLNENGDTVFVSRSENYLESSDPLLSNTYEGSLLFSDQSVSSGTYQMRIINSGGFFPGEGRSLELLVAQITEDAYRYELSREQFFQAEGNPFAEPVNVHSNILGGFGVFTVENELRFPIEQ